MIEVGIISDTHRLLRAEAIEALANADAIVHAGDIGAPEVIDQLRELAPVTAIRGNIDHGAWTAELRDDEVLEIGGRRLYVIHNVADLQHDPRAAGFDVVVSGHSHKPKVDHVDGVLYINPGSAGPRRFSLPVSLARLTLTANGLDTELVTLV